MRATAAVSGEASEPELVSLEQQVITFFDSKSMSMDSKDIKGCQHKPAIIICECTVQAGEKAEGNQHIWERTPDKEDGDTARLARFLRKHNKIQSTWTTNCKVFIKLNGSSEEAKVLVIRRLHNWRSTNDVNSQGNEPTLRYSFKWVVT